MTYKSVEWTPQTVVCAENLQQMSENIEYVYQQTVDNGKGIVGQEELTATVSKGGSKWGTVGTLRKVKTEAGRLYKYSVYLPKIENPGDNNNGASVQFQLRSSWGDDTDSHLVAYVWPGPIYRWTHFYGEVLISPGDVYRNYSLKYAPLFGVGKATIGLDNGELKGYITVEDVGSATQ